MVQLLKDVKPDSLQFEDVKREGSMYTARIKHKLSIQSPVVLCKERITNSNGETLPYMYITPDATLDTWLQQFEAYILDQAVQHKDAWFRKNTSDSDVQQTYKSYFRDNTFRLRMTDDVEIFDTTRTILNPGDLQPGTKVKLIMDLGRVSFGRTEWGCVWRVSQIMVQNTRGCLFTDEGDEGATSEVDDDFL